MSPIREAKRNSLKERDISWQREVASIRYIYAHWRRGGISKRRQAGSETGQGISNQETEDAEQYKMGKLSH